MGRSPCCAKEGLNRGAWSVIEDKALSNYISVHGEGQWRDLPQRAGLKRCGKSCRLRWLNYLKPDIKRGDISVEEEDLIIKLHKLLGNRWSLIARRLPGRTDNEIKNYWNTNFSKKGEQAAGDHKPQASTNKQRQSKKNKEKNGPSMKNSSLELRPMPEVIPHRVIRTRAVKCTRVTIPQDLPDHMLMKESLSPSLDRHDTSRTCPFSSGIQEGHESSNFIMDFDMNDPFILDILNSNFHQVNEVREDDNYNAMDADHHDVSNKNMSSLANDIDDDMLLLDDSTNIILLLENWMASHHLDQLRS